MKNIISAFIFCILFSNCIAQKFNLHNKVQVKFGNQWYNAEIIDVKNDQYKIHYDGYGNNWDEWVKADRIKQGNTANNSLSQQESNG